MWKLITSNQLTSNTNTVSFTIPSGVYFGLELRIFGRTTTGGYYTSPVAFTVNGSSPTNKYYRMMRNYPTATFSGYAGSGAIIDIGGNITSTAGSYVRFYNVSSSSPKCFEKFNYPEHRVAGGDSFTIGGGGAFSSSAPITSLSFTPDSGYGDFESGTRFDLYGII